MSKFVFLNAARDALGTEICEAAGIAPETVRRIVIDLEAGSPGRLYIEAFADDAILGVSINKLGIEVVSEEEAA